MGTPPQPVRAAERDLLFGVFAVQLGLVSAQELLSVAGAWAADRSRGLAQRLLEGRLLPEAMHRMLSAMVDEAVTAHGGDAGRTLETFGGQAALESSLGRSLILARDALGVLRPALAPEASPALTPRAPEPAAAEDALAVTPEAAGRYQLRNRATAQATRDRGQAEVGRGGIGRVLLAFDEHLGREVALKELLAPAGAGAPGRGDRLATGLARFLREARVTGQLEHPNIVPVYELGRRVDGALYYTMKMVRGRTLADAIRAARDLPARLKLLKHFVDLCHAVAYAHSRGVVHRDLKPENVMLGEFGETVVLDWGLAKVLGVADIRGEELAREAERLRDLGAGQTADGTALGTPSYMSPEAADGRLEEVNERSDVWSLGAVLYEILTGQPPFQGATVFEVLGKVLRAAPPRVVALVPEAPSELASVCEKALRKDRAQRYQSARELAAEVEAFLTGGRVRAYEYGLGELLRRFARRHRLPLAVLGVCLLMLAGLGVWAYLNEARGRQTAERLRASAEDASERARQRWAEAQREGARAALTRGELLEARAKLRTALEEVDSVGARVLWGKVRTSPEVWRKELGALLFHVAFSPDGREVAAAGNDGSIYLLDVDTAELRVLRGHTDWVATLAYAPDGERLVSTSADGSLRIWDPRAGRLLQVLTGHAGAIHDAAWSPDGALVASCSQDRSVRLWQASSGAELMRLEHDDIVWAVVFDASSGLLASADRKGWLRLWDPRSGAALVAVQQPGRGLACLDVSRDGRLLAAGGADGRVHVWRLDELRAGGAPGPFLELAGHADGVQDLAFAPDGAALASVSFDRHLRLWGLPEGRAVADLEVHRDYVGGVAFSPDGSLLATCSEDRGVALWRLPLSHPAPVARGHAGPVYALSVSPDGRLAASGAADGSLRVWQLASGREERVCTPCKEPLHGVAFSPDGREVWTLGWDRVARALGVAGGPAREVHLEGEADLMSPLAFDPLGRRVAGAAYDRSVWVWSLGTGRRLQRLVGHSDLVFRPAWSPDGRLLASPSWDRSVRLWESEGGRCVRVLRGHGAEVEAVAFSPEGQRLLSASWDGAVWLWRLPGGEGREVARSPRRVASLAFAPDGRRFALGGKDGVVELHDLEAPRARLLPAGRAAVNELVFTPDGRAVLGAGDDGSLRAWDAASGAPLWRPPLVVPAPDGPPWLASADGLRRGEDAGPPVQAERRWQRSLLEARAASSVGESLCLQSGEGEVGLWDRARDELRARADLGSVDRLVAAPDACLALSGGAARLLRPGAPVATLVEGASAASLGLEELLVATAGGVRIFDLLGQPLAELPGGEGASALLEGGMGEGGGAAWIAFGYPDGTVEIMDRHGGQARRNLSLERVPSSQVTRMLAGPMDSLFLGYGNGTVGLWDLRSGARLDALKLHGPVAQLVAWGERLTATTEVGDLVHWDLGLFAQGYCELLAEVRAGVPIVWADGRPARRPTPTLHPVCGSLGGPR